MSLEVNVTKRFDGFTLHAAFTAGGYRHRPSGRVRLRQKA